MPTTTTNLPSPIADLGNSKLLLVKIHEATIKERGSLYEAARRFWAISAATVRANNRSVIAISLENKTILEAYDVTGWHVIRTSTMKNGRAKDFYEFDGTPATAGSWLGGLVGKRVPSEYAQGRAIFRYVN